MHPAKYAPPTGSVVLERDRLLGRLLSWEDRKLVLITGPAGQGKTTLAAAYVRSLRALSVWFSLDAADDDPGVFLENLGRAVRRVVPEDTGDLPPIPLDPHPAKASFPAIANWARAVFPATKDCLIVIDDLRTPAAACPISRLLDALIAATPSTVRFLVLSRSRPALETGGLRAQRAFAEIGSSDLRFTDAEAADLFRTVFRMPVTTDDAARLNRMTEGWAAGLVLMHEYLASAQVPIANVPLPGERNVGYQENVFDYLAHEVFAHLPGELQDFLVRTSVPEHLSVPLAEALTGLPAGPASSPRTVTAMVNELRRRNLFITTIETGETAVRYHALFREFLVKQLLVSTAPSAVRRIYDTAAAHFLRAGDPVRAVELYAGSGQFEKAAPLIERAGRELIARGRTRTLARLLDILPPSEQERPWLLFFRAVTLRFSDPRSALRLHDRARVSFRSSEDTEGEILALCGTIEACFHSGGDFGHMERAAVRARQFVHTHKRVTRTARARLLQALGTAWFFTGRLDRSIDALRDAMQQFRSTGDHFHEVSCAVYLAPCALYRGDFALAQQIVRRGFEVQRSIPEDPGGEAALHLTHAMVSLFTGDISTADAAVTEGRRLVRENGLEAIDLLLLNIGGWVSFAQGDLRAAEMQLTECLRKAEQSGKQFFSDSASHLLSMLYLFQQKLDRAKLQADRAISGRPDDQSPLFRGIYLIMSGAIEGESGRNRQAVRVLTEALTLLRKTRAAQQEANAHLMLARFCSGAQNDTARARHLQEGFTIGSTRGFTYYAPFTEDQLTTLAEEAIAQDICADYCRSLIERSPVHSARPVVRVSCLGGFRVERNGTLIPEVQWKSKRAKALVKLLSVRSDGALSRDIIVDILWPDAPVERHAALLSSLLHRLRKVLDPPGYDVRSGSCITQIGHVLALDRNAVWTDVGAFLANVQRVRRMRAAGEDRGAVLKTCERAIELYGGELLPTDLYEDWITPERERLKRLYTEMLDTAAEISETIGEQERSRVLYERMFSFDPCHDQACRWLMARHMAEGHRHKAVRVYERHELAVRRELDTEPDERTRKLYRNIIGG